MCSQYHINLFYVRAVPMCDRHQVKGLIEGGSRIRLPYRPPYQQ